MQYKDTKEKVITLIEIDTLSLHITKTKDIREIAILFIMLYGLRRGEVCALKWENIDFNNLVLSVAHSAKRIYKKENNSNSSKTTLIAGNTKSFASNRELPMTKDICNLLKQLRLFNKEVFVFSLENKPLDPRTLSNVFKRMLKKLSIKNYTLHDLRHTFATYYANIESNIKVVQSFLGHSSINTTIRYYIHATLQQKLEVFNTNSKPVKKTLYSKSFFTNINILTNNLKKENDKKIKAGYIK